MGQVIESRSLTIIEHENLTRFRLQPTKAIFAFSRWWNEGGQWQRAQTDEELYDLFRRECPDLIPYPAFKGGLLLMGAAPLPPNDSL